MSRDGSVAPKERINIRYVPATGDASDDVELPLSMMVVGDFTARADETPIEERNPINIDKDNFNEVLEGYAPNIKANVENRLSDEEGAQIGVDITFKNMKDFTPESIAKSVPELNGLLELREALVALKGPLGNVPAFRKKIAAVLQDEEARKKLLDELSIGADQGEKSRVRKIMSAEAQAPEQEAALVESGSLLDSILNETRLKPSDEGFDVAKRGVEAFIGELLSSSTVEKVDQSLVDLMISEIDQKLSKQVDAILHNEEVQAIESTWRGLKYLVDHTDFRENIQIELISAKKDEVLDDFEDAPEVVKSGLYKQIYTREYGQFGGKPVGAVICDYQLSASSPDIKLMEYMGNVGAMSHAPFITSASSEFFGLDSYEELPNLKDLKSVFEGPQYTKWRGFREHEDARYVGLCTSRFMLRTPYSVEDNPIKAFDYDEMVTDSHDNYLWGNSAYAMASKISESFAKYRWCPNIIGPQSGGAVTDLPVYNFEAMGQIETKIPTEILVSDRREYELAEEGFMALTMRKGSDNAAFFSANSVQKPKVFANTPEGKQAEMNYKLGTQLPYMFIINRLAHYIKVLQREQIGSWKERTDLEVELNKWIRQYVSDQENPPAEVRGRRPLRAAKVEVSDVEGDPGWYKVSMSVRPHFKYMGASFDLSLVGKLDQ